MKSATLASFLACAFFAACSSIETPIDRLKAGKASQLELVYDPHAPCIDLCKERQPDEDPEFVRYPDRKQHAYDRVRIRIVPDPAGEKGKKVPVIVPASIPMVGEGPEEGKPEAQEPDKANLEAPAPKQEEKREPFHPHKPAFGKNLEFARL